MNAIAAIGGSGLFAIVDAYRARHPSEVWALGVKTPRDATDPFVRSLEALLEPFMDAYFASEAQSRVAVAQARTQTRSPESSEVEAETFDTAVAATLGTHLAPALALVEMLDRAHALAPIEFVVTDETSVLAQTAVAWARARALPAITVPAGVPLERPAIPLAERTVVLGERTRAAYAASGVEPPHLITLPGPADVRGEELTSARVQRRADARAAMTRALGWAPSDIVVVFDPAGCSRDSGRAWLDAFREALGTMFAAFASARASVSSLRLAVVTQPTAEGLAWAGAAAAAAGLAAGEFAYAQADHRLWIGGADIIVSADAGRAIEAAEAGVPTLNLRGRGSGYDGPAFAAEDGVIDTSAQALAPMIVALAGDAGIRAQIAAIADSRIGGDSLRSAYALERMTSELFALRRAPPAPTRKPKPDIVIWAPGYDHASGGIRALHRLCHLINLAGGNAWMHAATKLHPTWNTPRRDFPLTDRTIVIVPEIVFSHPSVKRIVRWVLNKPGLLGGPSTYGPEEMVFYYAEAFRAAAQAATSEQLTDERELSVFTVDPELFYNDRSRPRLYDCVYIGKGAQTYARLRTVGMRDALVIRRDEIVWPENRTETASLLRGCRRLFCFDPNTAIVDEAIICGAQAFYVLENGELLETGDDAREYAAGYVARYYDFSHVERFVKLVQERWD